jgi:hypothetical protein
MAFLPVSKIHSFAYNKVYQTLTISFGTGGTFRVVNFQKVPPEDFEEFQNTPDKNEYYLNTIRNKVSDGTYSYHTVL